MPIGNPGSYIVADRIKQKCSVVGIGVVTLGNSIISYKPFSDVAVNDDKFHFMLVNINTGEWETGLGTYNSNGTIVRTVVTASSNSDDLVDFAEGEKEIMIAFVSGNTVIRDSITNQLMVGNTTIDADSLIDGLVNKFFRASVTVNENTMLASGQSISVDTTGGSVDIILPPEPVLNDSVIITDGGGDKIFNPAYILRNGSTINGFNSDLIFNVPLARLNLIYDDTTWRMK